MAEEQGCRDCGAPTCNSRISASPYEMWSSRVDSGPEASPVTHTNPRGEEIIYIHEGSLEYQIEGQPPKIFSAGDALTVPAGVTRAVRMSAVATRRNHSPMSSEKASRSSRWPSERRSQVRPSVVVNRSMEVETYVQRN
jgi:hypothetical protein